MRPQGRLLRSWKPAVRPSTSLRVDSAQGGGEARLNGYLEDYACLADGLLAVYQATFDARYLREAIGLAGEMLDLFWDDDVQGFFDTGRDHEALITRPRELFDNATPSGTSVAADVLLRLAAITDKRDYEASAPACQRALAPAGEEAAAALGPPPAAPRRTRGRALHRLRASDAPPAPLARPARRRRQAHRLPLRTPRLPVA